MKNFDDILNTLADVVETNYTHVLSFELRKLSQSERREFSSYLRDISRHSEIKE